MTSSFSPAWWLPESHSQTLWPRFFRPRLPLPTVTETWDTPDGDEIDVVRLSAPPGAPRVLVIHGLEGSSRSHYAVGLFDQARRRAWGADLLLFRTCNGRLNRARRSYHSGDTEDLDLAVQRIQDEHPDSPLGLVGVSLGANVLIKWLGEQRDRVGPRVRGAVAVSTPFDLARSSRRIGRGLSRLYQWHFLRSLRAKALAKIERFPDVASPGAISGARTLWEFDEVFTAVLHGFRDAADYYAQSSSIGFLSSIRVPTLLLSARDDPFHAPEVLDEVASIAAGNACLTTEFPARGGHVGFIEGWVPWRARYYAEERIGTWLAARLCGEVRQRPHSEAGAWSQ
ncbi:MAG TPA: alpha/beta fold hydrolase [Gemmatimonadaceae bacterium]|nr:alpha/beta fold hydrolase [Gemmatimonadaceae bacterium]